MTTNLKLFIPLSLFALFTCFVLWMNICYSFSSDDCSFALLNKANADGVRIPLTHFSQLLPETLADGWRPVVHFFVRLFTGLLDKTVFNIANTLMMVGLCCLLHRLAKGRWKPTLPSAALLICLVLFILCKGESYLWCAGSLNYLWAGTAALAFYALIRHVETSRLSIPKILLCMLAASIAGMTQESFAVPTAFALGLYSLIHSRTLSLQKILIYGCYGCGILVLAFHGIAATRLAGVALSPTAILGTLIKVGFAIKAVWFLLLLLFLRHDRLDIIRRNQLELLIVLGSILLICGVGFNGERSLWCANLFAILIIVREFTPPRWLTYTLTIAPLPVYCITAVLGYHIKYEYESFDRLYMNSPEGITCHERVNCGPFSRFVYQSIYTWQKETGHNRAYGFYRERKTPPLALSKELYDGLYLTDLICIPKNKISINGYQIFTTTTANAYILPIPHMSSIPWDRVNVSVTYAQPVTPMDWLKRELAARRNPPITESTPVVLHAKHGDYLLFAKKPGCDAHLQSIEFTPPIQPHSLIEESTPQSIIQN
ncbi:MAG: DUF6056 family protein [Planctomycetia bacterium]